jgi:penicillin-binding protein 2
MAQKPQQFFTRQRVIRVIVILIASIFIIRLGFLQIIKGSDFRVESAAQAIKEDVVEPFRGNMYDRNGELMVHNEPSFSVYLTLNDFHRNRLPLLASILHTDTTEILKILDRSKNFSPFQGIKISGDIDFPTLSQIEEYSDMLPGVEVIIESKRLYDFDCNMSHFLGYTREITQDQLKKRGYFKQGEVVGQQGLEYSYDDFLRGQKGINFVAVTRNGEKIARFNSGINDMPVSNGFDLHLSIDKKLQESAEELMKDRRGAIVAIDPSNGEVLVLCSKPDFDPRKFSGKVPYDIYDALQNDPGKPLYNRALQSYYPPGSTWKMLVAIAGLAEGLITETSTLACNGAFQFGNRSFGCHGKHGSVAVRQAISASCNVFFYQLGLKLGLEKLSYYAKMFGFGEQTHIDLPNEGSGLMPTIAWLERKFGGPGRYPKGALVNYGIGQGEISVTPLQMALYCATLANKGTVNQPHVARAINNNQVHKMQKVDYASKKLPIDQHWFDVVREGMLGVVNSGTAVGIKMADIAIAGKTGTAQNPHGGDHSWFIAFAPYDNPKIAVACIVENAGFGSTVAAPIVRDIIAQYLGKAIAKKDTTQVQPKQ